ncbi:hypothetical protein SDC9_110103 [bioreactor metagenome]|uniref:Uncharacterized protein n=1 Tax=bioreactor metagenome TaxID=1076179 RepID=A0A645BJ50_9ZZZZ
MKGLQSQECAGSEDAVRAAGQVFQLDQALLHAAHTAAAVADTQGGVLGFAVLFLAGISHRALITLGVGAIQRVQRSGAGDAVCFQAVFPLESGESLRGLGAEDAVGLSLQIVERNQAGLQRDDLRADRTDAQHLLQGTGAGQAGARAGGYSGQRVESLLSRVIGDAVNQQVVAHLESLHGRFGF